MGCTWTNNQAQVGSQTEEVQTKSSEVTYLFQVETKAAKSLFGKWQERLKLKKKNSRVLERLEWKIHVVSYKRG